MEFKFTAIERNGDRRTTSAIRLELKGFDPQRGYACSLELSGHAQFKRLVYGATPFQASMLAHELARTLMEEAESRWRFEVPEMGEVSFGWGTPNESA